MRQHGIASDVEAEYIVMNKLLNRYIDVRNRPLLSSGFDGRRWFFRSYERGRNKFSDYESIQINFGILSVAIKIYRWGIVVEFIARMT